MLDRVHFLSNFLLKIDHKIHYTEDSKHVQPVTYSQFCESSMPTIKGHHSYKHSKNRNQSFCHLVS